MKNFTNTNFIKLLAVGSIHLFFENILKYTKKKIKKLVLKN